MGRAPRGGVPAEGRRILGEETGRLRKQLGRAAVLATSLALLGLAGIAPSAGAAGQLQMYEATVSQEQYRELVSGYDVVAPQQTPEGVAVDLVLSNAQRDLLSSKGIELELMRDAQGRTVQERAAAQAAGGFEVYRDWDGGDGLARYIRDFVKDNKRIAKLKVIGQSVQGRDILAVRLTDENDEGTRKGSHKREAPVLYQGTTHAREWISTEMTVRLMRWFGCSGSSRSSTRTATSTRSRAIACGERTCASTTTTACSTCATAST
jgi:hypothetical protein